MSNPGDLAPEDNKAQTSEKEPAAEITGEQVTTFLKRNPEFFVDHPAALDGLDIQAFGNPAQGLGYRMAGNTWPALNNQLDHFHGCALDQRRSFLIEIDVWIFYLCFNGHFEFSFC